MSASRQKGRMFIRTPSLMSGCQPMACLRERLPADEDVVGRLAFEDELELGLQLLGGLQAGVAAGFAGVHGGLLAADPVAEVGVGELFQIGVGELVIVHQRAEAVSCGRPRCAR